MKKIIALLLTVVLCLGLAACGCSRMGGSGSGGASMTNPFVGTWEICGLDLPSQGGITISVSGNNATLSVEGEQISAPFTLGREQGYQYMTLSVEGERLLLVLISENMLGLTSESYGEDEYGTLTIDGITYNGAFWPYDTVYMRSGSSTKTLPYSGMLNDFDEVEDYCYYPNERVLWVQTDSDGALIFYVENAREMHFMESIVLPITSGLPDDVIYTESGFVITDDI